MYGELDRAPLIIERHLRILKYWTKIISGKPNPLVCSMYRFMYQKCEMQREFVNWASLVKKLLNDLGLSQVWQQQSCGVTNLFLKICKQRLRDHFLQSWVSYVINSETAMFYKHFRMTPNYSVILEKIDINKYKYCFLKFIRETTIWPLLLADGTSPDQYHLMKDFVLHVTLNSLKMNRPTTLFSTVNCTTISVRDIFQNFIGKNLQWTS